MHDDDLAQELGELFGIERRRRHELFADVPSVLTTAQRSHRLGLLTNGASCLQREKLDASGAELFDAVVISGDLGVGKPDPHVFQHALTLLDGDPREATMVGDSMTATSMARSPQDFTRSGSTASNDPAPPSGQTSPRSQRSSISNPYGVLDIAANQGFVNVGITNETAQFSVASIRALWQQLGRERYPAAKTLQITADCGGSNGNRTRLWKTELQHLADETGLQIAVCHFPAGHQQVEPDRSTDSGASSATTGAASRWSHSR